MATQEAVHRDLTTRFFPAAQVSGQRIRCWRSTALRPFKQRCNEHALPIYTTKRGEERDGAHRLLGLQPAEGFKDVLGR
ncbi:hypothetical protein BE04_23215 [Sorangium cellulosum]|uniref:Uncharacterized protein n=1 Tax=Sorangium cellulosum TaxID=56 RepID=A0A150P6X2_SORCE|nr:hypothetical protein BE04_23215 [Sorangium cellulosum]